MHVRTIALAAATAAALLLSAAPVYAEMLAFTATLDGQQEVPPNDSAGTGKLEATYDTDSRLFKWTITYAGLTGDAVAAHFHGPADPGANAAPVVPIPDDRLASPIEGEATLDDAQAADLQAGKWYFNVHTAQYPDGEIRGQLTQAQ
ncbi:MAG TPA: CHRD domain-containing protein [Alphaproteobacteria bacterium]|nr:CHRD domain-containing protein [Alphaproteobacteria bacterium]